MVDLARDQDPELPDCRAPETPQLRAAVIDNYMCKGFRRVKWFFPGCYRSIALD